MWFYRTDQQLNVNWKDILLCLKIFELSHLRLDSALDQNFRDFYTSNMTPFNYKMMTIRCVHWWYEDICNTTVKLTNSERYQLPYPTRDYLTAIECNPHINIKIQSLSNSCNNLLMYGLRPG